MTVLKIDDGDPRIVYSPESSWISGGVLSDYLSTSTRTESSGAVASLTFSGSGISVWGSVPNTTQGGPPRSSFTLDGEVRWVQLSTQDPATKFQQEFFQSSPLAPDESHNLLITNLDKNSFFVLDFILVTDSPSSKLTPATLLHSSPSSPSPSSSTLSPSASSSSFSATQTLLGSSSGFVSIMTSSTRQTSTPDTSSSTATQPPTPTASQLKAQNGPPLAVVLGVGLGGLAFLLIGTFLLWKWSNIKKSTPDNARFWIQWPGSSSRSVERSGSLLNPQHIGHLVPENLEDATVYLESHATSLPPYVEL